MYDLHTNKVSLACGIHAVKADAIKFQLCKFRVESIGLDVVCSYEQTHYK